MTDDGIILEARDLHKSFGRGRARVDVLRGLNLRVRPGEFVAVMGPSGCGKTTLLHLLGLMSPPDAGEVRLDGRAVPRRAGRRNALRRTRFGFVFQRFNLLSMLSATDNVNVSLQVRGVRADGRAHELLAAMGVAGVARRKPAQMSIGEQQRVAIARALAHRPALLLADEPTGSLDSRNAEALLDLVGRVHRQDGQTVLLITHSPDVAARADRVVHMKDGVLLDEPG